MIYSKKILRKQILSVVLCFLLSLTCMPIRASATEIQEQGVNTVSGNDAALTEKMTEEVFTVAPDIGLPGNEELFAGYAEQVLYGNGLVSTFAVGENTAGSLLTGDEKAVYDALVPYIKEIASGTRSSAHIGLGQTVENVMIGDVTTTLTADRELTFAGNTFGQDNLNAVVTALMADYPYEMYWYDKTAGVSMMSVPNGEALLHLAFDFTVAANYRSTAESLYICDTTKTGATAASAAKAQTIVATYANVSDYEKLLGYKNEICSLVSYNTAAAEANNFAANSDPWQLIYVFDENTETNVVCEGYAKAFQYLCDLTTFTGDVSCYCVSGTMTGGTGAGAHMWNIVSLEGKNYLVDVTNSDEGTVGQNGELFLAGTSGSMESGYAFTIDENNAVSFSYDDSIKGLWGEGILILADSAYTVPEALSVTITWTSMEFTYSYGTWNPETLLYDGECGWRPAEGCGQITVGNNGEEAVTAIFTYTPERAEVSGSFTYEDANITDVSIAANDSVTVLLNLSGEPNEVLQNATLGKVTVTFSSSTDN